MIKNRKILLIFIFFIQEKKVMPTAKKIWTYLVIALVALVAAVNYELFVFPNQFAPAGLNGICTMIQHITGISVGYLSLLINVPLAIWCYIEVSKPVAMRSMVYVLTFSIGLVILDRVDLSAFAYATESGTSKILGPLVAGIIQGYIFSILMKASAYSGGTDFISAIVHKREPSKSVMGFSFTINVFVAVASYFVYGYQMEPVILCILYSFMSSTVGERLQKSGREAICFEIITAYPKEISMEIIQKLHHTTTLIPAKGMYSGRETNMLICVVNKTQAATVSRIVKKYPRTFAIMDPVSEVMGNFRDLNHDGSQVVHILDNGDGKTM
jgi:uncharacterized membrane-anchored protein YitT (DUF2179 family)